MIKDLATHERPYVTVGELADYLHFSERTIRRHIAKGALGVHRLGPYDVVRIPVEEARRYAAVPVFDDGEEDGDE